MRTITGGLVGATLGYACLTVLANAEPWPYYTIRSFVTGETAMIQIVQHPADWWVRAAMYFGVPVVGALVGMRWVRDTSSSR